MIDLITRRIAAICGWAGSQGLVVTQRFLDICPPGCWERPGLEQLLRQCRQGAIDLILVECQAQLAGNVADVALLHRFLEGCAVPMLPWWGPASALEADLLHSGGPWLYWRDSTSVGLQHLLARTGGEEGPPPDNNSPKEQGFCRLGRIDAQRGPGLPAWPEPRPQLHAKREV